jgi:2-polyprenyl-3-methyl-5-hydroxy-6-metoxy-1,4-benzoquinol methylase
MVKHSLFQLVKELGLSSEEDLELFHQGVRDNENIKAYRCRKSGLIILDDITSGATENYAQKKGLEYFQTTEINPDDRSRAETYKEDICGKIWLDFGCGQGGPTLLLREIAGEAHGLEVQPGPRGYLVSKGVICFSSLDEVADNTYDVITMFHVFEHLDQPVELLKILRRKLKVGGKLIVEVPHVRDALLMLYKSEEFTKFTLWSEHLILHTRKSLQSFVEAAGLEVTEVKGTQRYPISNHLYWLAKGKPGGHFEWAHLDTPDMFRAYAASLEANNLTDTIVATARKLDE